MTITMPRGDIRDVRFTVYDTDGEISSLDFDEIYFTVKRRTGDTEYLFQYTLTNGEIEKVESGVYQFTIEAADTDDLDIARYVFDIELCLGSAVKQTTVGTLELTPEVTCAYNEGDA